MMMISGETGTVVAVAEDAGAAPCGRSAEACRTCSALPRHQRATAWDGGTVQAEADVSAPWSDVPIIVRLEHPCA